MRHSYDLALLSSRYLLPDRRRQKQPQYPIRLTIIRAHSVRRCAGRALSVGGVDGRRAWYRKHGICGLVTHRARSDGPPTLSVPQQPRVLSPSRSSSPSTSILPAATVICHRVLLQPPQPCHQPPPAWSCCTAASRKRARRGQPTSGTVAIRTTAGHRSIPIKEPLRWLH